MGGVAIAVLLAASIDAGEGSQVGVIIVAPSGSLAPGVTRSDIIRIVDRELRRMTGLAARPYDTDLVKERCSEGSFACFVDRVAERDIRYLLVLSLSPRNDELRVGAVLLDAEEARACTGEKIEDCVLATSVAAQLSSKVVAVSELDEALTIFVESSREALGRSIGTIEIAAMTPGLPIELDGRTVGVSEEGATRIENVSAGLRKVALAGADRVTVEVISRRVVPISLVEPPSATARSFRQVLFWGGVVTAVAGAAVTGWGIAIGLEPDRVRYCEDCRGGFVGFGPAPESFDDGPRRLPILPLGYSLIGAGAAWTIGSELGPADDLPWIELASGAAIFVISYLLSAIFGGER